ncbi:unnamed protein product [Fraxinus pennsylvanica]|uniref:GIR1-like zinc ribbon domain-containing protein n=1 Tax=Fraxinus pennsylvanica TaxID=56036 RepID=A0AAD2A896_9LAMI|nr:unnamed protein product [Fraxinus pennsylvanica]
MALEVQNQQPQPLQLVYASGIAAAKTGAGHHRRIATALHHPPPPKELREPSHLKTGEEKKFLETKAMSRRNGPKLDLKLNLSPPRVNRARFDSPGRSSTSPPSSCVSSELINPDESLFYSNSPEATSMVLVGCPRCLMYVMLAEEDPKCPKCKSTVLLDIIHQKNTTSSKKTKKG